LGNGCIGVSFRTSLKQDVLLVRVRSAMIKARFFAPIIAATVIDDLDDVWKKEWRYYPFEEAGVNAPSVRFDAWLDHVLEVRTEPISLDDLVIETDHMVLPYKFQQADGTTIDSLVRFYLLLGGVDGDQGLVMHGPHLIMDAKPIMRLLDFILQHVVDPTSGPGIGEWGEEWRNLPVGALTATGGARDDWDTRGVALQKEIMGVRVSAVPSLTLEPSRPTITNAGAMHRVRETIDEATSREIMAQLKERGFSVTYLFDAAIAMSVLNSVKDSGGSISEDAHITIDPAIIGQDRFRVPQYNHVGQLATGVCFAPIKILAKDMEGKPTACEQLIHMMEVIKEQYLCLVSNPNLAHLNAADKGGRNTDGFLRFVLGRRTSANTNIGRVEDVIKTDHEVVKPLSLAIGHRLSWKQP
ncbi:hypothetical protein CONPUDRAFT_67887, partial [Coniophora puteana RWD-64-598 SS2]